MIWKNGAMHRERKLERSEGLNLAACGLAQLDSYERYKNSAKNESETRSSSKLRRLTQELTALQGFHVTCHIFLCITSRYKDE